jgi:hypothetical protein
MKEPVKSEEQQQTIESKIALVVGSWLVPGLGFVIKGNYWRGLIIFCLLNGTFFLGLLLHGTIMVPEYRYSEPAFNIVNLLLFVGQIGNGGASLLSQFFLTPDQPHLGILTPSDRNPWFDLAGLYLLVSGCMNYFCVCNFYDRYFGKRPEVEKDDKRKP